jgi:hypothetical protein
MLSAGTSDWGWRLIPQKCPYDFDPGSVGWG